MVKNFHTHELKAGKKWPEEAVERGQGMVSLRGLLFLDPNWFKVDRT